LWIPTQLNMFLKMAWLRFEYFCFLFFERYKYILIDSIFVGHFKLKIKAYAVILFTTVVFLSLPVISTLALQSWNKPGRHALQAFLWRVNFSTFPLNVILGSNFDKIDKNSSLSLKICKTREEMFCKLKPRDEASSEECFGQTFVGYDGKIRGARSFRQLAL